MLSSMRLLLLLFALALLLPACVSDPSSSLPLSNSPLPVSPPLASSALASSALASSALDPCLVGSWVSTQEVSTAPGLSISGFANTHMTITPSGIETTSYNASLPATGFVDTQSVFALRRGVWSFQDTAHNGLLTRHALFSSIVQTLTLNGGSPSSSPMRERPVSTLNYTCTPSRLQFSSFVVSPPSSFSDQYTRLP